MDEYDYEKIAEEFIKTQKYPKDLTQALKSGMLVFSEKWELGKLIYYLRGKLNQADISKMVEFLLMDMFNLVSKFVWDYEKNKWKQENVYDEKFCYTTHKLLYEAMGDNEAVVELERIWNKFYAEKYGKLTNIKVNGDGDDERNAGL